ncbi:hypothetical protein N474_19270 [Pseudoalteromonas luteoviolacea CPMOR-2]|uniref:hypothetical protein n=1 Tax=Pseudoalteromonas luteoviolacea TaxID=43657 RepID=UPI0007B076B8|nr:hypothetical protein [Pseudoalteromonas luteoviolacea]KZN53855.1 hypothetical protein N474_19270 [Pseudoalteromonas luteoviolacea CPMOR-2]
MTNKYPIIVSQTNIATLASAEILAFALKPVRIAMIEEERSCYVTSKLPATKKSQQYTLSIHRSVKSSNHNMWEVYFAQ